MSENATKVDVTFYDNYVPSIKDGTYTLTVSQALTADTPKVKSPPEPPVSQTFIVRGPRFGLVPADIHRAFPPPTSTGVFVDFLPMIVFNKRSLPWERTVAFPVANSEQYPWMALLVFSQDELPVPQSSPGVSEAQPPSNSQANPTRTASFALTDVVHATWKGQPTKGPPAGIVGPTITLAEDEDPNEIQVNVIEVPAGAFANLAPIAKDLPFLSHVRQVSTENKEPQNAVHDGWYSVLIGNRFAVPPKGAPQLTNVVHLVSLEGLEGTIGLDAPKTPPGPVRMISLYSWVYTSLPAPQENFRELMLNLISASSKQGTDLMLRLPVENEPATPSAAQKSAIDRLHNGYLPMSYATYTGEQTFAWYRGPLAAAVTQRFMEPVLPAAANGYVPRNTSEAMVYDPLSGLFDQSYAVAFQTGRLMALADQPFAMNLLQWRRDAHAMVDVLMEYLRSPHLSGVLSRRGILDVNGELGSASVDDLAPLLDPDIVSKAFLSYLATGFGKSIVKHVGQTGAVMPANINGLAARPVPPPPTPADLARLTEHPSVVSLLQGRSGLAEPGVKSAQNGSGIMPPEIVEWLTQAAMLYGVPFNNLVPSTRMLPEESIRFFYADSNWVDALLDGALSVGVQSSRDELFQKLMREPLHYRVKSALHQVRQRLRHVDLSSEADPPALISGFVLRSAVVSGWPGLEVRAFSDAARTKLITPLRLDRLAPSVMIGLFPEVPAAIEFNEPSEGLVFGQEEAGISLRYLPGTQGATPNNIGDLLSPPVWLTPAEIGALRRAAPAGTGALKIAGTGGMVEALQSKFPGTAPALSPASLAVEMVHVPEQMLFLPVPKNGAH